MSNLIRIQLRRDRQEYWVDENTVLHAGEVGIGYPDIPLANVPLVVQQSGATTADQEKAIKDWKAGQALGKAIGMKIGDGLNPWNNLDYVHPFAPITPNGRQQRDLSGFASITAAAASGKTFNTAWEILDAIMHPYVPPTAGLARDLGNIYEIGTVQSGLTLDLTHTGGSNYVNLVQIWETTLKAIDAAGHTYLGAATSTGATQPIGNPFSITLNNFAVLPTTGSSLQAGKVWYRQFQGKVQNSRTPTNDYKLSNVVNVQYAYPSFMGMSKTDLIATSGNVYTASGLTKITDSNGIVISNSNNLNWNLNDGDEHWFYFAYPKSYGPLTSIKQGPNELFLGQAFAENVSSAGAYPWTVSVSSVGLNSNWTIDYYLYRTCEPKASGGQASNFTWVR